MHNYHQSSYNEPPLALASPSGSMDRLHLLEDFEHDPRHQQVENVGSLLQSASGTGLSRRESTSSSSQSTIEEQPPRNELSFDFSSFPSDYNPDGTSTISTSFLIVNAALGAGILNFPKAYDEAGGIVVAVIVQAILMAFILIALLILAFCADQNMSKTIQEAMQTSAGKWGRRLTSLIVILYTFGTTITFLIIIGDQFDRVFDSLYGDTFCHYWYMNRNFTMTVSSILIILPMCFSKKIDFLKIPSTLGVFAIFYIVALIVYEYFCGGITPGPIKTKPDSLIDVFFVVPVICFGYQCHVSVIPIYSCMKHRRLGHFTFASFLAIFICVLCYTLSATFGYLTFGGNVDSDILMSFSANRPEVVVAILAMALKTFTTYPILLFCGREAVRSMIEDAISCASNQERLSDTQSSQLNSRNRQMISIPVTNNESAKREIVIRFGVVIIWFVTSLAMAILIPNIGEVISILGSLAAVFIFVLPGVGLFQYAHRSDPSGYLIKTRIFFVVSVLFIILGAFLFGVVLTQAIEYDVHAGSKYSLGIIINSNTSELCQI